MRSPFWMLVGLSIVSCARPRESDPTTQVEPTCAARSAISLAQFTGTSLPPKTLALTFDDGPGTRTSELSSYLASHGIEAGFFVVGASVATKPGALGQIVTDGHLVANHTEAHVDLTTFPATPAGSAALEAQLATNDARIAPFVPAARFLFRAPYGAWSSQAYAVVHAGPMDKYVGPIRWDVGGARTAVAAADWACWQDAPKLTTKACGDLYLSEIEAVGRGIVLMHDADNGDIANHALDAGVGNTVDMVRYIVPILKARGYSFVRVDRVPAIDAELPAPPPPPPDAGADASDASSPDAAEPDAGTTTPEPTTPRQRHTADAATASPPVSPAPEPWQEPCNAALEPSPHVH